MQERVTVLNEDPVRKGGDYVLYWSQMNRRVRHNHALAYAIMQADQLALPLLVYEGLTCTYPYANDRLHTFLVEGSPATAAELKKLGIGYVFYLRRRKSDRNDTLYELARSAALVVTDDYPVFIAPKHNASVPAKIGVAYHAVESSCVIPLNKHEKREFAAYTIRPKIQRMLPEYLKPVATSKPKLRWTGRLPEWHVEVDPRNVNELVASCEIDHDVKPSTAFRGGSANGKKRLQRFLEERLRTYARDRNEPSSHATSRMSPYLHFGHVSALEMALAAKDHAAGHQLVADEFLEELIVRRELAFNFSRFRGEGSFADLPSWAQQTLRDHARDVRDPKYSDTELEQARTYDELWNATQKELLLRGSIHGYYRMYWGKKIVEWSASHELAWKLMTYLHDRYSLDGRDPNTYANVLWCFGLHDRPFQERNIFGKVRYMSYGGMKRKTDIDAYIAEIDSIQRGGRDPEWL